MASAGANYLTLGQSDLSVAKDGRHERPKQRLGREFLGFHALFPFSTNFVHVQERVLVKQ